MHDTRVVISEAKKTAMETTINYILIKWQGKPIKAISFLIFPMTKFILNITRSTTYNPVKIMCYLSNNTFWVRVVPWIFNDIKYTPLE